MFSLAGFENVRLINDAEVDVRPLTVTDWLEESDVDLPQPPTTIPTITDIQMQFFIENCKLTQLG